MKGILVFATLLGVRRSHEILLDADDIICLHIDDYVNQQNNLLLVGTECRTVIAARCHIQ